MRFVVLLLLVVLLAGCQATPAAPTMPVPAPPPAPVQDAESLMLAVWLREADSALQLTAADAHERLAATQPEASGPAERFRVALLNQQIGEWDAWVVARDTLRELHADQSLPPDVRRLAGLLESFNQSRINAWQQRMEQRKILDEQTELIATTRQEVEALEQKIRSLTSLEDSMNQRRDEQSEKR